MFSFQRNNSDPNYLRYEITKENKIKIEIRTITSDHAGVFLSRLNNVCGNLIESS